MNLELWNNMDYANLSYILEYYCNYVYNINYYLKK